MLNASRAILLTLISHVFIAQNQIAQSAMRRLPGCVQSADGVQLLQVEIAFFSQLSIAINRLKQFVLDVTMGFISKIMHV